LDFVFADMEIQFYAPLKKGQAGKCKKPCWGGLVIKMLIIFPLTYHILLLISMIDEYSQIGQKRKLPAAQALTSGEGDDTLPPLKSFEKEVFFAARFREETFGASLRSRKKTAPLSCMAEMPCRKPPLSGMKCASKDANSGGTAGYQLALSRNFGLGCFLLP